MIIRWIIGVALCWSLSASFVTAQEPVESAPSEAKPQVIKQLKTLLPGIKQAEENLDLARAQLERAATDQERAEAEAEVDAARARLDALQSDFMSLASGVDEDQFLGKEEQALTIQQTLQDILEPISRGVRELTAEPRELEAIRQSLELAREREILAEAAVTRISNLLQQTEDDPIRRQLEQTRDQWAERHDAAEVRVNILRQQLDIRSQDQHSTLERMSAVLRDFWRSRGMNLLIAIGVALLSIFIVRRSARLIAGAIPKKGKSGLAGKTTQLIIQFVAALAAIIAVILVFYIRGDWLLLALVILVLLGILWASRQALPPFIEQIRIILNLGSVREDERMIYEGVPYRVKRLNYRCYFDNPELQGGRLWLPVRDVIHRVSRRPGHDEPWFPTKLNDWVILADETYGKVVHQSPDQVVVLRLGGSRKVYPTADFLAQSPESLSRGFRISLTFGIDYTHQPIATTTVPATFQKTIEEELAKSFDHEAIHSVKVEFASAGSSSLDYEILADFDGSLASRRNVIERRIQSICVDVCNTHQWGIPFTQITLHQSNH